MARKARNKVTSTSTEVGDLLTEPTQIPQQFLLFFQNLLAIQAAEMASLDINVAGDGPCLTIRSTNETKEGYHQGGGIISSKNLPLDNAPDIDVFIDKFF